MTGFDLRQERIRVANTSRFACRIRDGQKHPTLQMGRHGHIRKSTPSVVTSKHG